jgi:signal transduction histidine kinase
MISLRQRLNRGLAITLFAIFAVHWFAADWVIRTVAEKQMMTRLEHDSDSLLQTLKMDAGEITFENSRIPLVYDQQYSGHYFVLQIAERKYESVSLNLQHLLVEPVAIDEVKHYYLPGPQQQPLLVLTRSINKQGQVITLTIAEDLTEIGKDILHIRLAYLGITILILILAIVLQSLDVKRAMLPLRKVVIELNQIAIGQQEQILTEVPAEIQPLVNEVNRLIILIARRLQQSRTAIGNLAHALKTPLAVLVRVGENPELAAHVELKQLLISQTEIIEERIQRELKRARLAGHIQSGAAFNPYQEISVLAKLLNNVYPDKNLDIYINAPNHLIPFDREDILEIIGNLADNACKWAHKTVNITVSFQQILTISIEDDGPGCPEHELKLLAQRGVRLDETVQGHGLGLAIARDIALFYSGRMQLARSPNLGGLLVTVKI